jgi:hypothetical protein
MSYKIDRIYSYIVTHDNGFAPNPFWGFCSLACCKPKIRKSVGVLKKTTAYKSIWIVGLSPKRGNNGNKIIYMMEVTAIMSFEEYWRSHPEKRPVFSKSNQKQRRGDNIYEPDASSPSGFRQLRSAHSLNPKDDLQWAQNPESIEHDLGGEYVLLSNKYIYFGSSPIALPSELRELVVGRAHKCHFAKEVLESFSHFLEGYRDQIEVGTVVSIPHMWSDSEKPKCASS